MHEYAYMASVMSDVHASFKRILSPSHSPPVHLLYWYEEAAGETGHTGNDGGETEGPEGEGADESYQQRSPALVEDEVHNHHLTKHLEVVGIGIHQLQMEAKTKMQRASAW